MLVLAIQLLYALVAPPDIAGQGLRDADSYMRVLRVLDLHDKGNWYNSHFYRTNAPFGETLHWGRPLDGVLYGMAWIISRFTDFRSAVYLAGLVLGPVLMLVSIPLWSWGTRPILSDRSFLIMFGLMTMTLQFTGELELGRPDHHGFLIVLFIAQLAAICRLATGSGGRKTAYVLGVAGGIALWASVEALLVQGVFAVMLAFLFWRRMEEATARIRAYGMGLWATLTIALVLERPPSAWFTPDYIRISIVQWTLAAAVALTWWAIQRFGDSRARSESKRDRFLILAVGAAVPLAVMACAFPEFFGGPLIGHDQAVMDPWFATIEEFQPLLPTTLTRLLFFLIHFGPVLVGIVAVTYELIYDPERRDLHAALLCMLAVYGSLALASGRWVIYAQALCLVPWAFAIQQLMQRPKPRDDSAAQYAARLVSVPMLFCAPFLMAATGIVFIPMPSYVAQAKACDWAGIESFLRDLHARDGRDEIIFTYLYRGPEIVWHTPYSVVSAPYGNDDALRDTNLIFQATADPVAESRIGVRDVGLILICRDEPENDLYRKPADNSLLTRLEDGRHPDWVVPIPLPNGLAPSFKLFRVARNRLTPLQVH